MQLDTSGARCDVQDPDTPASVAELWKPSQREKLADMLAATLKQAVGEVATCLVSAAGAAAQPCSARLCVMRTLWPRDLSLHLECVPERTAV
jgi:hypothetical protein